METINHMGPFNNIITFPCKYDFHKKVGPVSFRGQGVMIFPFSWTLPPGAYRLQGSGTDSFSYDFTVVKCCTKFSAVFDSNWPPGTSGQGVFLTVTHENVNRRFNIVGQTYQEVFFSSVSFSVF